jgi:hypothetical protein
MQEAMAEFQGSPEEIRCQAYYDNWVIIGMYMQLKRRYCTYLHTYIPRNLVSAL